LPNGPYGWAGRDCDTPPMRPSAGHCPPTPVMADMLTSASKEKTHCSSPRQCGNKHGSRLSWRAPPFPRHPTQPQPQPHPLQPLLPPPPSRPHLPSRVYHTPAWCYLRLLLPTPPSWCLPLPLLLSYYYSPDLLTPLLTPLLTRLTIFSIFSICTTGLYRSSENASLSPPTACECLPRPSPRTPVSLLLSSLSPTATPQVLTSVPPRPRRSRVFSS